MTTIEDNDVRCFGAVFVFQVFNEDIAMAETATGLRTDKDGFLLLLHQLLVDVEVIGF